jgi:hypothetical protein
MTDIEIRNQQAAVETYSDNAMDRLARWVQQADAVFALADRICSTSFAPAAYRGKPAEAAAAMLAGAELGFDPMASLRAFDNIQGVPAPKAITLRAVVQGQGHKVHIVESTAERAVVRGLRRGETEWQESIWDMGRARAMGLTEKAADPNKNPWKKQPQAMLVARATAEVCRWIASDAIMGMPYAAEEIEDQPALAPSPAVHRLTVAELDEPPTALQAAVVEATVEMVTDKQRKQMSALWGELGYSDSEEDRRKRLWLTAQILGITEPLESSNDLTAAEADRLITALRERKERTGGEPE